MKFTIESIHLRRNGISAALFFVVLFTDTGDEGRRKLVIVFESPWHTAVPSVEKLAQADIAFGSNSWRGDRYEPRLRRAIGEARP